MQPWGLEECYMFVQRHVCLKAFSAHEYLALHFKEPMENIDLTHSGIRWYFGVKKMFLWLFHFSTWDSTFCLMSSLLHVLFLWCTQLVIGDSKKKPFALLSCFLIKFVCTLFLLLLVGVSAKCRRASRLRWQLSLILILLILLSLYAAQTM